MKFIISVILVAPFIAIPTMLVWEAVTGQSSDSPFPFIAGGVAVLAWAMWQYRRLQSDNNTPKIMVVTTTKKARKFNFWGLLIFLAGAWAFYEGVLKDVFGG